MLTLLGILNVLVGEDILLLLPSSLCAILPGKAGHSCQDLLSQKVQQHAPLLFPVHKKGELTKRGKQALDLLKMIDEKGMIFVATRIINTSDN